MHQLFEATWLPIITPFSHGRVDRAALATLAQHYASQGIRGFVACATTGEGAMLTLDEQAQVLECMRSAVPKHPVVMGLSQPGTAAAVDLAKTLASWHPDGLLVTAPTYVRPTQDGVRRHFEAVVQAADMPVLIYDIPYRTGVTLELDTLQALAGDNRIVGVKLCGADVDRCTRIVHETGLQVLCGDDLQNFAALCLGAHGSIAASAHVMPQQHVRIAQLLAAGQRTQALQLWLALLPLIRLLFAQPNPAPLKALLAAQGWCGDELRLPFVPVDPALADSLLQAWNALQ